MAWRDKRSSKANNEDGYDSVDELTSEEESESESSSPFSFKPIFEMPLPTNIETTSPAPAVPEVLAVAPLVADLPDLPPRGSAPSHVNAPRTPRAAERLKPAQSRRQNARRTREPVQTERVDEALQSVATGNLEPLRVLLGELTSRIAELEDSMATAGMRTAGMNPSLRAPAATEIENRYDRESAYRPLSTELGEMIRDTLRTNTRK